MWHTHGYNRDCFPVFTNQPIKRYSICLFRFSSALADALRMLEIFVVKKKKKFSWWFAYSNALYAYRYLDLYGTVCGFVKVR